MLSIGLAGLLAAGCIANEAVVTTQVETQDSAAPETGDTDTLPTDDTADTETTPPEMVPDYARWRGSLHFVGDTWMGSCDDTVEEVGRLLPKSHPAYSACGACDVVFELEPSPDEGCVVNSTVSLPLANPTLRGLNLGSGWAAVYNLEEDNGRLEARLLDSGGVLEEGLLTFAYNENVLGELVDVTGSVRFPLVEAE